MEFPRQLYRWKSQTAAHRARRDRLPASTTSLSFPRRWIHPSAALQLLYSYILQANFRSASPAFRLPVLTLFSSGRIDDCLDFRNTIRGEAALGCMLAYHFFDRRNMYTIHFVAGDVAMHPLNLRAQLLQCVT